MIQKFKIHWKAMKMEIKEHKSSFIVYMVLRALVILIMILQILNKNYQDVFYCILTLLLLIVPSFLQVELGRTAHHPRDYYIAFYCGGRGVGRNRFILYEDTGLGYDASHN